MATTIGSSTFPTGSAATSLMSKLPQLAAGGLTATAHKPNGRALEVRAKFQDFAAGTFYKELLKSLRSGQKHSKYFYGGQAEEIFRGQLDQQIAEDMARQSGGSFANPLFDAYERQANLAQSPPQSRNHFAPNRSLNQLSTAGGAHALDAVA
jgi:Rod binding domain-containing protein